MKTTIPYGSWPSPLTAAAVAAASPRIEGARFVGDDIWWGESVPDEGGRTTVCRRSALGEAPGPIEVVLPAPWNARSRVHEYGGGAWTVTADGALAFVHNDDQRVWLMSDGDGPWPVTPADRGMRFGGLTWQRGRLLAIRETHRPGSPPHRDIVEVPLDRTAAWDERAILSLTEDSDFLAQPALSSDGTHLAWIAWDHPHMPWDTTELRVGRLEDGLVAEWATIAGGDGTAPLQPVWTGEDDLVYSDDPSGRWNLWRLRLTADLHHGPIAPADADTGGALWGLALKWFAVLEDGRIVAVRTNGDDQLVVAAPDGAATTLEIGAAANINIEDVRGSQVLLTASGARGSAELWLVDANEPASAALIAGGSSPWGAEWMPVPRAVTFDGPHGPVHAFDYAPTNPEVDAPDGELPPYVVFVHGGPTSHVGAAASGKIAYLTSRGVGVLDVNYGGSTGYGREYRERLLGQWGVVDVDDVIAAARGLAESGRADPRRLAIAGGSAGGWTVLCAVTASDTFSAGISRYGVADLRRLAEDTHDFESHYLDSMVGPLPDAEERYIERSPLSHLERLTTPMLIEQGLDDHVVPPSQSEAVRDALAANGVPHAYLAFAGEGHGFRLAATVARSLEAELAFLGQIFGFEPPGVPALDLD
ncbi:S9 family peptidase [Microbacterium deminutum]|uniref:S9 family peptidase n=1 Tax=Microbacterium deminutum TaxID=344164 RepID=UPI0031E28CBD